MYRQNTALMALFEQVTTFDPEVRALRQAARERMVGRVRHSIESLQADGLVDAGLDAEYSAHALVAMVNGLVHYWLVLGADFDEERLVRTMTGLWAQVARPARRGLDALPQLRRRCGWSACRCPRS